MDGDATRVYQTQFGQSETMLLFRHDSATCDRCDSTMWYGLKEEPTGWKVFYVCHSTGGCGAEWKLGRVGMDSIESLDEAYRQADEMWVQRGKKARRSATHRQFSIDSWTGFW